MSQVTQSTVSIRNQLRAHWIVALSALLALLATAAVVLVVAIDSGPSITSGSVAEQQPALRADGGPDESAVAASIGSPSSAGPDESRTASSIAGTTLRPTGGPDESSVAASLPKTATPSGGPDESATAASIAGH
jgi:hypothetical protein